MYDGSHLTACQMAVVLQAKGVKVFGLAAARHGTCLFTVMLVRLCRQIAFPPH
jgi:hypothetical protein